MDRALRFNRMMEMRKGLESEWVAAHEDKILRDNDEREHRMNYFSPKILILQVLINKRKFFFKDMHTMAI